MAAEYPWNTSGWNNNDLALDTDTYDQSPLATATRRAGVKVNLWDLRAGMEEIAKQVEGAPNIDHGNELELVHCIGSEALWKILNGIPPNGTPQGRIIMVPMEEVYKLKREVSLVFEENRD